MAIMEEKVKVNEEKPKNILTNEEGGIKINKVVEEIEKEMNIEIDNLNEDKDIVEAVSKIDFKKVSKEKMFNVIVQLVMENKKMRAYLVKSENESGESLEKLNRVKDGKDRTEKEVHKLAMKISPLYKAFKNSPLGMNKDANIHEMVDFIYKDYLNEKKVSQDKLLVFLNERADSKKILDNLTKQLERYMNVPKNEDTNDFEGVTEEDLEVNEDPTKVKEETDGNEENLQEIVLTDGADFVMRTVEVPEIVAKLGDDEKNIIRILGEGEVSTQTEIIKSAFDKYGISEAKTKTVISTLDALNVVTADIITSFRIRNGFKVVELTPSLGKLVHRRIFNKAPKISEADQIRRAHDNLNHGYSIRDVCDELGKLGYKNITSEREDNRIRVAQGKTWIPDIIAINPTNNANEYFEVESGSMSDADFSEKLTKSKMKATVLKIIVPNTLVKDRKKNQVERWKSSSGDTTMNIYIMTFQELTKKEDGYLIKA